jgi:hypothetical protein
VSWISGKDLSILTYPRRATMVTTVSIRLALRKLADVTCGTAPSLIRVTARVEGSRRIYSAAIPWEYRDEVLSFLRQHLDCVLLMQGPLLVMTEAEAAAVVALSESTDVELALVTEPQELT